MYNSTQIIYNSSTFKAPKTQVINIKTSRPIAGVKQPLTSRYAQGSYHPAEEQKQKISVLCPSSYARKHSLENVYGNDKEQMGQSTKRVKMQADARPSTAARLPLSSNTSTNVVAAAKMSLKEKQMLKEKRIRKTGVVKPKSTASVRASQQSLLPINQTLSTNTKYNHNDIVLESAKLKPIITKKVRDDINSRRDSRYSFDGSYDSIIKEKIGDVSEMQIDADLLPVQITAMGSSSLSKPKTIHVARASRKLSVTESKCEVEEKKIRPVLAAIPPQTIKKISNISTARISSVNTILKESRINELKSKTSTSVSVIKKQAISKAVVQKPKYKPCKKPVILQDPIQALEYSEDIYVYWREIEISMLPDPLYIQRQNELDWGMRSTLVSWLLQVHSQFKLLPETLYLTVNLIDRTLSLKLISLSKLQLVGITALLIASKYEEILSPSVQDLVYMTDNSYTGDEILRAERHMLSVTGYQIGYCNPLNFLKRVANHDPNDARVESLCHYFLELMALDHQFIGCLPSKQAAAAYFLAIKTIHDGEWTNEHYKKSGYREQDLLSCVYTLLECLKKSQDHRVIFEKYENPQFHSVSTAMRAFLREKGI